MKTAREVAAELEAKAFGRWFDPYGNGHAVYCGRIREDVAAALEAYHEGRLVAALGHDPPGVGEIRRFYEEFREDADMELVDLADALLAAYDLMRDRLMLWARDEGVELALAQAREEGRREQWAKDVEAAKASHRRNYPGGDATNALSWDVARAVEAAGPPPSK